MIDRRIILASASPRRKELLEQIGLKFEVIPSTEPERLDFNLPLEDMVKKLAYQKVFSVSKNLIGSFLVIGADTVVSNGNILGKPVDEKDAYNMLKSLSGNWHKVATGVAVADTYSGQIEVSSEVTHVKMRAFGDDEINSYIKTGEPMDKAGAYGIQGLGALLVERIEGCYFNVVGLPLNNLGIILRKFNLNAEISRQPHR